MRPGQTAASRRDGSRSGGHPRHCVGRSAQCRVGPDRRRGSSDRRDRHETDMQDDHGGVRTARGQRRRRHDPARPAEDERAERRRCRRRSARPRPRRPTRDDVRAVVVYGGEQVFAAGADIKEMADMSYADMVQRSRRRSSRRSPRVARIPKPVVAAVTGYALGGGCELALCADVRFAAEDAVLGQPEILLGIIPGAGGTQRLSRLVGPEPGEGHHLHRPLREGRRGAGASAWSTRSCRPTEVYAEARRVGGPVRAGRDVRPAGGQGGDRPRARGRPRHRAGDRAAAVRGPVRDRGPRRSG